MRRKVLLLTCAAAMLAVVSISKARAQAENRTVIRLAQTPRSVVRPTPPARITVAPPAPGQLAQAIEQEITAKLGAAPLFLNAGERDNTRVDLDLENVTLEDAVRKLIDQVKGTFAIDNGTPKDRRVTIKAKGVRLSTALDFLADAYGVGWTVDTESGKSRYRFGKDVPTQRFGLTMKGMLPSSALANAHGYLSRLSPNSVFYSFDAVEERSTFNCPHCKGQSTILRTRQQPRCTKCSRVFQKEWQFCPADGAKRPAAPVEWKYCPSCGKEVRMQKSEGPEGEPMALDLESNPVAGGVAPDENTAEEGFYLIR